MSQKFSKFFQRVIDDRQRDKQIEKELEQRDKQKKLEKRDEILTEQLENGYIEDQIVSQEELVNGEQPLQQEEDTEAEQKGSKEVPDLSKEEDSILLMEAPPEFEVNK